jgi:hypothetical protein
MKLFNRGQRSFHLGDGRVFKPGEAIDVDGAEAKALLGYGGEVVDVEAKKAAPPPVAAPKKKVGTKAPEKAPEE